MRKIKKVERVCKTCGISFMAAKSQVKLGLGIYCRIQCYWESLRIPAVERFWKHVDTTGDCWIWTAALNSRGYGQFSDDAGDMIRAHRFSYQLAKGKIENGLFVLHKCDNPVCVRPEHLFLGTHEENMADMRRKNRKPVGERHKMSKITELDVLKIREMAGVKTTKEICEAFGLGRSQVHRIIKRESWWHI